MEKRNEGAIISGRPSTAHVAYVQVPRALPLPDGILAKLGGEHNRLERGVGLPEGDAFFENWNDASTGTWVHRDPPHHHRLSFRHKSSR